MRLRSDCGGNAQNGQAADVPSEWMTVAEMQKYMHAGRTDIADDGQSVHFLDIHGTIMVKSTGEALLDADDNPITAPAEFVAKASEGAVDVTFALDTTSLKEGDELVAFEECLSFEGNLVAAHQDIDDASQTVVIDNPDTPKVPKTPYDKTGATAPDSPVAIIAIAWVYVPGTSIDYPVVMGGDQDPGFYLFHDVEGINFPWGTPYVANGCEQGLDSPLVMICGHHMTAP